MPQSNVPNAIAILEDASWRLRSALCRLAPAGDTAAIAYVADANAQIRKVLEADVFKSPLSE